MTGEEIHSGSVFSGEKRTVDINYMEKTISISAFLKHAK